MLTYFPKKQRKFISLKSKWAFNADLFPQKASEIYFPIKQVGMTPENPFSMCVILATRFLLY